MKKLENTPNNDSSVFEIICGQKDYAPRDFSLREIALIALNSQTPPPAKEAALADLHARLNDFESCIACAKNKNHPDDLCDIALQKAFDFATSPKELAILVERLRRAENVESMQLVAQKLLPQITLEAIQEIEIISLYFKDEELAMELSAKAIELAWDNFEALSNLHCFCREEIGERLWELAQTLEEKRIAFSKHYGTNDRAEEKILELVAMETDANALAKIHKDYFLKNETVQAAAFERMKQVFTQDEWMLVLKNTRHESIRSKEVQLEAVRRIQNSLDFDFGKELLSGSGSSKEITQMVLEIMAKNAINDDQISFVFNHAAATPYVRELCTIRNIELSGKFKNNPTFLSSPSPELTSAQESTSQNALPSNTIVETNAEFIQTTPDSLAQKSPKEAPQGSKYSKWLSGLRRIF